MKLFNRKRLDITALIIFISITLGVMYYTWEQYTHYTTLKQQKSALTDIKYLHQLLRSISQEREDAALFLTDTQNALLLNNLKKSQNEVNSAITEVKKGMKNALPLTFFERFEKIKELRESLFKDDIVFDSLYIQGYTQSYSQFIINEIHTIKQNFEMIPGFNTLKDLIELEENIAIEKSFIRYFLLKQQILNDQQLVIWNRLIHNDYAPKFDELTRIPSSEKLNSMVQKDLFITKINTLRAKIILASASNQFSAIDIKSWNHIEESKLLNISKSINLLLTQMNKTLDSTISSIEKEFMIIAIILLILLIQFIVLYIRFKSSKEDDAGFHEAIDAIKHTLKDKQIEELNKIIKKQDKIKLYNFMANVIDESSRAKDLFFASMSHEIRTPLNGILGFTELLQSTKLTSEQEEFVKTINSSSHNLVNILNDILDFSKIKENKVELESIEFDPFDVFESAIELYSAKADEKEINLQLFIDTNIDTTLKGDPTKLAQIIVNLISNAIKFTPHEGTVEVKVEKLSSKDGVSTIKFSVKDTGIGVSEDQKQNIFKAFSQENVSTTRNFGGTGLGLSISSQFAEAMGGNLDIESVKGKGATFFFVAKFTELNPIQVEKNSFNIAFCMPHDKENKSERKAIEKYITLTGAKYFEYDSIASLIDSDDLDTLDIVFVDSTNEEKLKKITKSNVKIIYVTTLNNVNKKEKKHILYADEVIYKPLYFNKLQRSIATCMQNNKPSSNHEKSLSFGFNDLKVLVAEDNLINQKLLTHILSTINVTPVVASNGKEAFELYQKQTFDILLMDVQMPVMGGVEAMQTIVSYEQEHQLHHVPVIALTANTLEGDKEKLLHEGMDGYLPKPIDLNEIKSLFEEKFPSKILSLASNSDIILYKNQISERKLYKAIFESLGYTVDIVNNVNEYINAIDQTTYTYSFADHTLFDTNPNLSNQLKTKGIKNILFLDSAIKNKSQAFFMEFDDIIPSIADRGLLEYYMQKL